jgi:protein-tyrosine phosphatase
VVKPDVYWVVTGTLMAGEYPGARSQPEARLRLEALCAGGIRSLVDLTEAHELEPYGALARELGLVWHRFPIRDLSIPTEPQMTKILACIDAEIADGRPVYVHCWGGIGRTGTVIGCLLVERGMDPADVLAQMSELRRNTQKALRVSPETKQQRQFVRSWSSRGDTLTPGS